MYKSFIHLYTYTESKRGILVFIESFDFGFGRAVCRKNYAPHAWGLGLLLFLLFLGL